MRMVTIDAELLCAMLDNIAERNIIFGMEHSPYKTPQALCARNVQSVEDLQTWVKGQPDA